MTLKQLENLSPPIMKQVLPLVEQLPPLYADLVNGRENFTPKPEETRRLVCKISILFLKSYDITCILPCFCTSFCFKSQQNSVNSSLLRYETKNFRHRILGLLAQENLYRILSEES